MSPLRSFLVPSSDGHTRLAHSHLIPREAFPVCGRCQVRLSIFYILVECPTFSVSSNQFFPSLMWVLNSLLYSTCVVWEVFEEEQVRRTELEVRVERVQVRRKLRVKG